MNRPFALAGFAGVALNVLAVAALRAVPHTYAPGDVGAWLAETRAHPDASTLSAVAFTFGLVALAAFAAGLARGGSATVGAVFFGAGALLDAAGTMAPVAALHVGDDAGRALLWMTLVLDSSFNGLLGIGLLFLAADAALWPKPLRALAAVAGLASLPVGLQFTSDAFARLLVVAGPLWLTVVVWASVLMWKKPRG